MMDPPRPKVQQSVRRLKQAGVQVVMITGDYKDTAFAVARNIGIAESFDQCMTGMELDVMPEAVFEEKMKNIRVFARVTPAHKVKIVKRFRENGEIVANQIKIKVEKNKVAPPFKEVELNIYYGKGFDKDSEIVLISKNGEEERHTVSELCPYPFDETDL